MPLYSEFKSWTGLAFCQVCFHSASLEIIPKRIILVWPPPAARPPWVPSGARPELQPPKPKPGLLPVGQPPSVAWPQIERKPLELHMFLVRHPPLSCWHCQGDQSPEEATGRTDDTSPLKDFRDLFHQNPQPYLPPFPLYSSPLENTHAMQYPPLQTQDHVSCGTHVLISEIPIEDDQALLWKLLSPSCSLSQALPWDTAFLGTPQTAAPGASSTTVGVWQAFPWPSLLLPGRLSPPFL